MNSTLRAVDEPDDATPQRAWRTLGLCALAAAAFVAAFPPIDAWPLVALTPWALTIAAVGARSTRIAVACVFATSFVQWFVLHGWIAEVTIFGWPVLAAYLAATTSLYVWLVRRLRRRGPCSRWPFTVLVPIAWTAVEVFRGSVFMNGYPWFLAAHPLIGFPTIVQGADLFGAYGLSALVACVAGAAADATAAWRGRFAPRTAFVCLGAGGLLCVAAIAYGAWRLSQTGVVSDGPVLLAIQTNLPQSNKKRWTPEEQRRDLPSFVRLTMDALKATDRRANIIVWPETMVPGFGFEPATTTFLAKLAANERIGPGDQWVQFMVDAVAAFDLPLIVGSPCRVNLGVAEGDKGKVWTWSRSYNSAYLLVPGAEPPFQRYDKVFLTPFGETMPYISSWPWLEERLLALGAAGMTFDLDAADEARRLVVPFGDADVGIGTPICFEDTVPAVCRRLVWNADGAKAAPILATLANEGWFGEHDAVRERHVQIARFRCIENRVPMVRAANTGLSVHIDSNGFLIGAPGSGRHSLFRQTGWVEARTRLDERVTLYSRIGDVFGHACLLGVLVLLAGTFRTSRTSRE
jgi:apolipoprotein N-acyltransferase